MTTLHVVLGLHRRSGSLAAATVEQVGNRARLEVARVLAVHVAHDLALFETDQHVGHYLDFVADDGLALGEPLFVTGYLDRLKRHDAARRCLPGQTRLCRYDAVS